MVDERWTKFKVRGDYKAPVSAIYEAWATRSGIEKWFLREALFYNAFEKPRAPEEFIQPEDTYLWRWHGYADDVFEKGTILEANGVDFIKFSFSGGSIVSVKIEMQNGLTVAELTQENIPVEADPSRNLFVGCQTGWLFYMANMKSVMEGGVDLRNKQVGMLSSFK